jgi:hypothetical protein
MRILHRYLRADECRDDTGANVQSIHDDAEFEYAEEARYAVEMRKFELINSKFYK